jgi:Tfp pilus assembly protein FimV
MSLDPATFDPYVARIRAIADDLASAIAPATAAGPEPVPAEPAAAAPAPAADPVPEPPATVTVQDGETLADVAARIGSDVDALFAANRGLIGSNPDTVKPGQVLDLPAA